jgi:hypothetical protein
MTRAILRATGPPSKKRAEGRGCGAGGAPAARQRRYNLVSRVRPVDCHSPSQFLTPPVTPSSASVSKLTDNLTHLALAPAVQ